MACLDSTGNPKRTYPNKTSAERAITERRRENPTLDLRSYRCKGCGLFHLTHIPDRYAKGGDAA